jgi:hypothetical protein
MPLAAPELPSRTRRDPQLVLTQLRDELAAEAMAVRNKRLAAGTYATANARQTLYTVPTGYATIVKYIAVNSYGSGASTVQFLVNIPGLAEVILAVVSAAANTSAVWAGWIALSAGDTVEIIGTDASQYFVVSGAELPLSTP